MVTVVSRDESFPLPDRAVSDARAVEREMGKRLIEKKGGKKKKRVEEKNRSWAVAVGKMYLMRRVRLHRGERRVHPDQGGLVIAVRMHQVVLAIEHGRVFLQGRVGLGHSRSDQRQRREVLGVSGR